MLCTTCHKFENDTATAPCGFCESIAFPEHVLCELTRGAQEKLKRFRCDAFRAKLSLVGEGRKKLNEAEPDNVLGAAQKYRLAVALQQLQKNPDEIRHALKYHLCFVTRKRAPIFDGAELLIAPMIDGIMALDTNVKGIMKARLLWFAADHIHIYLEGTPDCSAHSLASAARKRVGAITDTLLPGANIWEKFYFTGTIG